VNVVGDADPINYIYMTRDLELDATALEADPTAAIIARPAH